MEKETKKNNWWKSNALTLILIVACVGYIGFMWFHLGQQGISKDIGQWNSLGGAIGGVIGTLLSGYVAILVYRTYQLQKEEITSLRASAEEQNFLNIFNTLYSIREKSIENITIVGQDKTIKMTGNNAIAHIINLIINSTDYLINLPNKTPKFQIDLIAEQKITELHKINPIKIKYAIALEQISLTRNFSLQNENMEPEERITKLNQIFNNRNETKLFIELYDITNRHFTMHNITSINILNKVTKHLYRTILESKLKNNLQYLDTVNNTTSMEMTELIKILALIDKEWQDANFTQIEDSLLYKCRIAKEDKNYNELFETIQRRNYEEHMSTKQCYLRSQY